MKNKIWSKLLIVLLCCIAILLVRFGIACYRVYASGYRPVSVADFFYRLQDAKRLPQFTARSDEQYEVGGYTLHTLQCDSVAGYMPIRAVEVPSAFGAYYRFPEWNFDAMQIRQYKETYRADMYALFLDDGVMIEIISDEKYTDNFGEASVTIDYQENKLGTGVYDQFFWIPNELPKDYLLQCEAEDLYFDYEIIMECYELKNG